MNGVSKISVTEDVCLISFNNIPRDLSVTSQIMTEFAVQDINIDMISQSAPIGESANVSFTVQSEYFKLTHGKRIFKMAPLHHHFEMCGWKETKVVAVFAAVSTIFCVLAYLGVMDRFGA